VIYLWGKLETMSMSDTAEYWWDVKNRVPRIPSIPMIHIPKSTCGHISKMTGNTAISNYLNDISCYACLKMIKQNGNIYGLKEGVSPRQQSEMDKEKHRYRFGKCECGSPMCERKNSKTGQTFLGCANYPKCKKTKTLNK